MSMSKHRRTIYRVRGKEMTSAEIKKRFKLSQNAIHYYSSKSKYNNNAKSTIEPIGEYRVMHIATNIKTGEVIKGTREYVAEKTYCNEQTVTVYANTGRIYVDEWKYTTELTKFVYE